MGHPKKRPRAGVTYSTTEMDFARLSTGQWTICSDDWHMEAPSAPQVHTSRARDLLVLLLCELTMSESAAKNIRQNRFAAGRLEKGTLTLPVVVARPRDTTRQTHDRSSMHINLSAFCMPFWCCPLYFIFFSSSSLPLAVGLATPSHTKWLGLPKPLLPLPMAQCYIPLPRIGNRRRRWPRLRVLEARLFPASRLRR